MSKLDFYVHIEMRKVTIHDNPAPGCRYRLLWTTPTCEYHAWKSPSCKGFQDHLPRAGNAVINHWLASSGTGKAIDVRYVGSTSPARRAKKISKNQMGLL